MSDITLNWPGKGSTPPPESPNPYPVEGTEDNRNFLLQGDNYVWLNWLLEKGVKADLIYMDPPFCTGNRFASKIRTRAGNLEVESLGFRDYWSTGMGNFLEMLRARLDLCWQLLKDTGSIFVHLDWRTAHATKLIMDEIFGSKNFRNEIIWWYHDPSGYTRKNYLRKHDTILFYSRSADYKFNLEEVRVPYSQGTLYQAEKGVVSFGRKTRVNPRGKPPEDVWEVPIINSQARERLGYPTQKPLELLERIVRGSSDPGDLVVDPFCGSGTTLEAADKLGRNWIGIDQNNFGLFLARKRTKGPCFFARDRNFLLKKSEELQEGYYQKNPSPGAKVIVGTGKKGIDEVLKHKDEEVHWWDIDYPWERVDELEKGKENLFLFPLYDQTGLPLGRLHYSLESKSGELIICIDDYEQPAGENSPLKKIKPEEGLDTINLLLDGKKISSIMPPFPQRFTLPLTGDEREVVLQVVDIFGRQRKITGSIN